MSIEIGSYLKEAREKLGLTLEQLQEMTKIQKSFILAIEKGEFQKLPSPFYVRTYLRSYANCVKVEPHHILRQYRKEEQAERGLTGAHKIIDETSLQATFPPENKDLGAHSGVKNRVTTNMALTIAQSRDTKAQNEPLHKERVLKEIARRSAGYQGVGEVTIPGTKNVLNPTQLSLSKTNPPLRNVQNNWDGLDQEISAWGSSSEPEVAEPSFPPRQVTSRQATLNYSGSFPVLEGSPSSQLTRSTTKSRKLTTLQMAMWVIILCGVGGLLYIAYKKFFS